jgi:hypothetical protein
VELETIKRSRKSIFHKISLLLVMQHNIQVFKKIN